MKKLENNRRVKRTQELLRQTLVALIIEKGYEAITVQDIIDRAGVARSTFYAHFYDKEDLLMSGFDKLHEELDTHRRLSLSNQIFPQDAIVELSLALFQHAQNYHSLYKAIVGKLSGELVLKKIYDTLALPMRECLKLHWTEEPKQPIPFEVMLHFIVTSLLGLLTWWLNQDLPYSAEEMNKMFQHLALQQVLILNNPGSHSKNLPIKPNNREEVGG